MNQAESDPLHIGTEHNGKKAKDAASREAEALRFEATMKGERPKLRITFGFSELDPTTNEKKFWDMWVKFPFEIEKSKADIIKKAFQNEFEKIFYGQAEH